MNQGVPNWQSLHAALKSAGEEVSIDAREILPLSANTTAWLILSGEVNIFQMEDAAGQAAGPREYLFSRFAGELLVDMFTTDEAHETTMVAIGQPGTTALRVPLTALAPSSLSSAHGDTSVALLEDWLQCISKLLPDRMPPRRRVAIDVGDQDPLEQTSPVCAHEGVVWIDVPGNETRYVHQPLRPKSGTLGYLPVTRWTWLNHPETDNIRTATTRQLIDSGGMHHPALDNFHRTVLNILEVRKRMRARARIANLTHSFDSDRERISSTLHRMATIRESDSETAPAASGSHEPPLVTAVRTVCGAMGMSLPRVNWADASQKGREMLDELVMGAQLRKRKVILKGEWWVTDPGPLLGYRKYGEDLEPVALLPRPGAKMVLEEPAAGDRVVINESVAATVAPEAWQLYRPFPEGEITPSTLIKFMLHGVKRDLVEVLAVGMLGGLLGLVTPMVTAEVFDSVIPGAERGLLLQMVLALLLMALGQSVFRITRNIAMLRSETMMNTMIQAAIWDRLISLPLPFFRNYTAGDLAVRAQGIDTIRRTLSGVVLGTVLSGIFSIWYLAYMVYLNGTLTLWAIGLLSIAILVAASTSLQQIRSQRALVAQQGKISGLLFQFLNGMAKLRVAGTEDRAFCKWGDAFSEQREETYKASEIRNRFVVFDSVFPVLSSIVIFYVVQDSLMEPGAGFTLGTFLAFFSAYGSLTAAGLDLVESLLSVLQIVPLWERVKPIIDEPTEVVRAGECPTELTGQIEVDRLCFRYAPDGPLVIDDVSLSISPGEFVAIIGPSGSGKTTLFRMLLGFDSPASGSIYYDGQSLSRLDIREVRRQLGVVLQTSQVVTGSIYENIAGSNNITQKEAWMAAKMAAFHEDIQAMPMGIHTQIFPGGSTLSGGQRQRLIIARALARSPRILLFDEATSALDNRTQAMVSESLENLQVTRIVIAHRLSTIRNADRIIVLDRGRIIEQGDYDTLMAQDGLFASLANRQNA